MPSDDLILNVKQIDGYPATASVMPSDAIVLQRGGLGGPYLSISPALFVGSALANGGGMAIGGQLLAASVQAGSAQISNAAVNLLSAQKACVVNFDATWGSVGGVPIATQDWVNNLVAGVRAASVWSVNGRVGDIRLTILDIAGGAPIFSPRFDGQPRAPTPAPGSCSTRLATTAFVHGSIVAYINSCLADHPFVFTFNGRSGEVVLSAADIEAALSGGTIPYAPLDSPQFTGMPTAPTAPPGSTTGQIATTAFVMEAVAASVAGVATFNGRTGNVVLTGADLTAAGGALLASPVFTGTPQAPTAPLGTSTAQLATTAFVMNELGGSNLGVVSFNGRDGAVTLNSNDISNAGGATTAYVNAAVAAAVVSFNGRTGAVTFTANDLSAVGGAPLASPAFTGAPTAPTATAGTSTGQLATTAFVQAALASVGGVTSFNGRAGAVTLTSADLNALGGPFLPLAGGTLTGSLTINEANPGLSLNKSAAGNTNSIWGSVGGVARWLLTLGNTAAESGANAGSDFAIVRYSDTGALLAGALTIARVDGAVATGGAMSVGGNLIVAGGGVSIPAPAGGSPIVQMTQAGTNRAAFWFNTTNGATTMLDQYSGAALFIDPAGNFTYNGGSGVAFKVGGGEWTALSDARIKTVRRSYDKGLTDILKLNPVVYVYKGNDTASGELIFTKPPNSGPLSRVAFGGDPPYPASPHYGPAKAGTEFVGLVAQDVEPVFPDMVARETGFIDGEPVSDLRAIDVSNLTYALVNAIKTLAARVAALEAA